MVSGGDFCRLLNEGFVPHRRHLALHKVNIS
jgi:hypothetical protein